jgi:hypothetical protein
MMELTMDKAISERLDRLEQTNQRLEEECRRLGRQAHRGKGISRLALLVAIAAPIVGHTGRTIEAQQAVPKGEPATDATAVVAAQRALCRRALEIIELATVRGVPAHDQAYQEFAWSSRLLGTEIYLSLAKEEPKTESPEVYLTLPGIKPNPERLAAFEGFFQRMKRWEERLRELVERGAMSPLDYANVEERRLQAEAWVAREKLKSKQADEKSR